MGSCSAPPPISSWSVEFDGIDDYLQTPSIADVVGISLWLKVDPSSPNIVNRQAAYLVDGRGADNNDVVFANR